jgi:hypothetical protein
MRSCPALLLLAILVAGKSYAQIPPTGGAPSASDRRTLSHLPDGSGKELVVKHCAGACHEMQRIEESQGTRNEWMARIRRMIRRGAVIPPESFEPLATYLAAALPPRVRSQATTASPIAVTLGEAAVRPIQTWVRVGGTLQGDAQTILVALSAPDAALVKAGQRVRAFAMGSRSSMLQARVSNVDTKADGARVQVRLAVPAREDNYLVEIITESGAMLSIPNEAIIEEGERQVVYVQSKSGDFEPRVVVTGLQGETYTQVVTGLEPAERVVTFGSFFIDAEYKMKSGQ